MLAAAKLASAGYVARPRFTKAEEENLLGWGEQAMVFVPSLLGRLTLDSDHLHYRVTLCALGEEIPVKGSDGLYFIPSWAVDDGRTWKPTMRDPGDGWAISQSCFVHSTPIDFELDVLGVDLYAEHLHRVLEVGNRATVEVIQLVSGFVAELQTKDDIDCIRELLRTGCVAALCGPTGLQSWKGEQRLLALQRLIPKQMQLKITARRLRSNE